ncbi:MAG: hypothetical protein PHW02_01875 [bacterium]|nr:hypothetical protein [bacterium]
MMFKTITAAKILISQKLFDEALNILEEIENDDNRLKAWHMKAICLEGLNRNDEAETLCYKLIEEKWVEENVYEILERIFSKKKPPKEKDEEQLPEEEMAAAYELLNDNENALKWYYKKVESLKKKIESQEN